MDSQTQREPTIREQLPWVKLTMDYMDRIAATIPEDQLDWRPEDPSGNFCFSLVEIVKHANDARIMFLSQLTGEEEPEGYWSEGPGEDGSWKFSGHRDKAEVLERLNQSRAVAEEWLDKPASMLMETTPGTRKTFDSMIERLKEAGGPVDEWERRGPASVNRVLMALAVHEAGHRGALQTLLRQQGINVEGAE
jgi:uncharacterized damage-inducible protein DinB